MFPYLLPLHSLLRWLVLASLLFSLFRAYPGWLRKKSFTKLDKTLRYTTVTIAHIQLLIGLALYLISPITQYFLHHFNEALHQRQMRFFSMEHATMMLLAIVILTIGSAKSKRKPTEMEKFKTMALWFTAALLIILSSIPWGFSPLVSRPYFRPFY